MLLQHKEKITLARLGLIAGLIVFLLWMIFSTISAQSNPISEEAYWQLVTDTQSWLRNGPTPDSWAAQAERWSQIKKVELADGAVIPVNTAEIVQMLQSKQPDLNRLNNYLSGLQQGRERWSKSGDGASELADLQKILARPEFQGESGNFFQRLYQKVLDFFLKLLDKLFPDSGSLEIPLPAELVIALAVLILVGILAFVFRDVWRSILPETEMDAENPGDSEILSASQASQRALQLSSTGEYRQAVRYMYLSALLLLDERGLLRYNRSQTNREYLRQVASHPDLTSHLRPVIETFDRVWYGYQTVDQDSYAQYTEQVAALQETKE